MLEEKDSEPTDITRVLIGGIIIIGIWFVIGSVIFFQPIDGNDYYVVDTINCDIRIVSDNDTLELTLLSGIVQWQGKMVQVNDSTLSTGTIRSSAGDAVYFHSENMSFEKGIAYKVRIIDIGDNKVVYQEYITVK